MIDVGVPATKRRLPFVFRAQGGTGRLSLSALPVGPYLDVERLELDVADVSVEDPEDAPAERFQRRRCQLSRLTVRLGQDALNNRVETTRRQLAALGISQVHARLGDGFVSVRARIADGLAVAEVSFRVFVAHFGTVLRVLAGAVRVHGQLPIPGPLIADRVMSALLMVGEGDATSDRRPITRGLCDVEVDLVGGLLWHLLPPRGWRLPRTSGVELSQLRIGRAGIEVAYAPVGMRSDAEIGVGALAIQLATAHELMRSADELMRDGQLEDAMRGYRALLASGGPDQPIVLGRILALAATRSSWFYDGVELARQALARWPHFSPAHAALAAITLAQGDARAAASHLHAVARLASGEGDDDEAAVASLSGARLLRILEPRASTPLYQLALEHDPGSLESADSLAERLSEEARWPELVRLLRARAVTAAPERAAQIRLRLAEVLAYELGDAAAAHAEVGSALEVAPFDPSVHEMAAMLREMAGDPAAARLAWLEVIDLAQHRSAAGDRRIEARAWARLGTLSEPDAAEAAWQRALGLHPAEPEAVRGLARSHRERGEYNEAIALYERMRGAGLPLHLSAPFELDLARCLIDIDRIEDARAALRRAAVGRSETAAEAHAVLADVAAASDPHHAAAEFDTAIASLVDLAEGAPASEGHRLFRRAAQLAVERADLLARQGDEAAATGDLQRAHFLSANHDAQVARMAARALLERSGDDPSAERRWLDAVLATEPDAAEKAQLLIRSATARRRQSPPDVGSALAEIREASRLSIDAELRRRALELEAELLSDLGNQRARAAALSSLAELTTATNERVATEIAAAAAWLAADDAAAALPHAAAAAALCDQPDVSLAPALRRHVLSTFGEAAWRQCAWPDVVRAYTELVGDTPPGSTERAGYLLRIAMAADQSGDAVVAKTSVLAILDSDRLGSPTALLAEVRGNALRLLADIADRTDDGLHTAATLERFAASSGGETTHAARAEAMYRAGELYRRGGQLEDAVRCLELALRISDTHLAALDSLELAWRERGDLERVAAVIGRKVSATRHPARQKSLLVRLGDLQAQLGRPELARTTHLRALAIDPSWRPSLRFLAQADLRSGQLVGAARTYAQLAGELPGDGDDVVEGDRQLAALALVDLLPALETAAEIALVRQAMTRHRDLPEVAELLRQADAKDGTDHGSGMTAAPPAISDSISSSKHGSDRESEEITLINRGDASRATARQFHVTGRIARRRGDLNEALAAFETAQHLAPNDPGLLAELIEVAQQTGDLAAAARHLSSLAHLATTPNRRAEAFIELADLYYDHLDDPKAARAAMMAAADALGATARGEATLRVLASEAASNLAWHTVVTAISRIAADRRTSADVMQLAVALCRCGRDASAVELISTELLRLGSAGEDLLGQLRAGQARKRALASDLEAKAQTMVPAEADVLWREAIALWRDGVGDVAAADRVAALWLAWSERPTDPATDVDVQTHAAADLAADGNGNADLAADGNADPDAQRHAAADGNADADPDAQSHAAADLAADGNADPDPDAQSHAAADLAADGNADPDPDVQTCAAELAADVDPANVDPDAQTHAADVDLAADPDAQTHPAADVDPAVDAAPWVRNGFLPLRPVEVVARPTPMAADHNEFESDSARPQPSSPRRALELDSDLDDDEVTTSRLAGTSVFIAHDDDDDDVGMFAAFDRRLAAIIPAAAIPTELDNEVATSRLATADEFLEIGEPDLALDAPSLIPELFLEDSEAIARPVEDEPRTAPIATRIAAAEPPRARSITAALAAIAREQEPHSRAPAHPGTPELTPIAVTAPPSERKRKPVDRHDRASTSKAAHHAEAASLFRLANAELARGKLEIATTLLSRAYDLDPSYAPVLLPLADRLATSGDRATAQRLFEQAAISPQLSEARRQWARVRMEGLSRERPNAAAAEFAAGTKTGPKGPDLGSVALPVRPDRHHSAPSVDQEDSAPSPRGRVSQGQPDRSALTEVHELLAAGRLPQAIALAEKVASEAESDDLAALELLERLYLEIGDSSAASETIGRQLMVTEHATARSMLWRRRARMYRELGREPQAYRCLKEAHACDPDHPDHAYELRCAAMARREWGLAASLLLGEIAAATADRDRAALHFELGLVFDERLGDSEQAIRNFEVALALDPTIPAVHAPLARQYEAQGRHREAAFHFEKAASSGASLPISATPGVSREAGTPSPLFAIATDHGPSSNPELAYQQEVPEPSPVPDLATLEQQLEDALTLGDRGAIRATGRRLWQHSPGNAVAFSALAREYSADRDLWALIEITAVRAAMTAEGSQRAPLWIDVARLAEQLGEDPQAARAYDLALIEDPANPTALDARAGLAFRVGDFATAEMIYRDIEAADSILPADELLLRRSVIAESLERSDEALTFAQAAATAAPGRIELQRRVQELATRAGDLATALSAARSVMALVPLDQEQDVLDSHFTLVGLLHAIGDHAGAVANLEHLRRDHPGNRDVIAALASVQADRGDWTAACHYLSMLVPLAKSLQERALRLFELGEVFLTKVGDLERADDAFLRASDLDPGCVPALRRLVDSYWRADHLGSVVDITADLAARGALFEPEMEPVTLGRAALAVAIADDFSLAGQILGALGVEAAGSVVAALIELVGREHQLTVGNACGALRVLHQAGVVDLHAIMAMAEHPEVRHQLHQAAQS